MRINKKTLAAVLSISVIIFPCFAGGQQISLTDAEADWIGNRIFINECGGKEENIVSWNEGEDFMSLGIGHFIWYPKYKKGPFDESFPEMLRFIEERGEILPDWLKKEDGSYCPWRSREEFLSDRQSPKIRDLRKILNLTRALQLRFIIDRLDKALPDMLKAAPKISRSEIEKQFYRTAATPAGLYALVDYVNFKGEGILSTESYGGHGWGLLQVLERMKGSEAGESAIREFVRAAEGLLEERVINSPPGRNEERWLPGWKNRLNTYIDSISDIPE